jgi:hypothetical protein
VRLAGSAADTTSRQEGSHWQFGRPHRTKAARTELPYLSSLAPVPSLEPMKANFVAAAVLLAAVAWSQTPPPKITPSTEGPGTEAGKEGKPGASWSESAKSGKQANDGTGGGHAAADFKKQKSAEQKANQDGGPVVIPAPQAKP